MASANGSRYQMDMFLWDVRTPGGSIRNSISVALCAIYFA